MMSSRAVSSSWFVRNRVGCSRSRFHRDHRDLPDRALVVVQTDVFFKIANGLVASFGNIDDGLGPLRSGDLVQAAKQSGAAAADGDEGNTPLVEFGQLGIGNQFGIEVKPSGVGTGDVLPEVDELQRLGGLIGAQEIGVGITEDAAFVFLSEQSQNAGASLAAHGEEVIVETAGLAAKRDRVEVEREGGARREQHRRERFDPAGKKLLLVRALRAVGIVGGEAFLGQDVEAGEEAQGLIAVEVVDVAAAFLVEQFQGEQAQQSAGSGNHA